MEKSKLKQYKNCKNCIYVNKVKHRGVVKLMGCKAGYINGPIKRNNGNQVIKHIKPLEPCEKTWKRNGGENESMLRV